MLPGCHVPRAQRGLHTEHDTQIKLTRLRTDGDLWRGQEGYEQNARDWNVHVLSDDKISPPVSFFVRLYSLFVASMGREQRELKKGLVLKNLPLLRFQQLKEREIKCTCEEGTEDE